MSVRPTKRRVVIAAAVAAACAALAVEVVAVVPEARVGWVRLLGRAGALDTLVGFLEDEALDVRIAASESLVGRGADAAPALARGLGRLGEGGRGLAAGALGAIGPGARDALPALRSAMLADESDPVREAAAGALGRVARDDPAAVAELLGLLDAGGPAERVGASRATLGLGDADRRRAVPALAGC